MNMALDVTSGVCWSLVYIAAIVLGIRRKTWCIPKLAICQNFSWEFWIVIDRFILGQTDDVPFMIQFTWLVLDGIVLILWMKYDRNKTRPMLQNAGLLCLVFCIIGLLVFVNGYEEFVAFLINLIMSVLFVIRQRRDMSQWTSLFIAVAKLIGTFSATILNGMIFLNMTTLWLGGLCLIFDMAYLLRLMGKSE